MAAIFFYKFNSKLALFGKNWLLIAHQFYIWNKGEILLHWVSMLQFAVAGCPFDSCFAEAQNRNCKNKIDVRAARDNSVELRAQVYKKSPRNLLNLSAVWATNKS